MVPKGVHLPARPEGPPRAQGPARTDGDGLARTRERFLTAESIPPNEVRQPILASWWRSRHWHVAADRVKLPYVRDPDLDTLLTRSAMPVLRNLRDHLEGQPISVILTDSAGVVLTRMTADRDLERHLDSVQLAPGFSYAEEYAGTNGIGTALEGGQPAHVFGHEHYAEDLEDLACAGVPIHDPISGKAIGAVDLTCWRRDADPLLIVLAKTTADQITQAMLAESSSRELQLMKEYLRACRHSSGIVLALNNDVVMMNDYARQVLEPGDQSVLLGQAAEALASSQAGAVSVQLPSGIQGRMSCRPVRDGELLAGGVVQVKLAEPAGRPAGEVTVRPVMSLPGVVGGGALWLRGCRQVEAVYDCGDWLAVEGEPGVGKLTVARAVHQRRNPAERCCVLDAAGAADPGWLAQARRELLDDGAGALLIRHLDLLGPRQLHTLAGALQEARKQEARQAGRRRPWVAATLSREHATSDLTAVLRFFPSTVELPPLRHHIEDLQVLVPFFLAKLGQHGRLGCAPEAMQLLLRSKWPGNTQQLWQVLRQVVQKRRSGTIVAADLPAECWTVSRRLLSPLESMERDAIVQGLLDYQGNKVQAAKSLGMSRATIYRKIHEYGIVTPTG